MCGFPTSCLEIQLLALVGLDVMVINEIPGPDQKIFQIRFVSNLDICKIVNECPGQHHVKAQVWNFET